MSFTILNVKDKNRIQIYRSYQHKVHNGIENGTHIILMKTDKKQKR